ncbi:AMP-binding protein [Okeania sp. SIO3B5]|uniref:AMP-binding enzyme n=1 Tax=Okeania sp. SIO3B5 TaxID=2607811 RepID=UPI0025D5CAB6|nr:AMP-binding protein [Okeania sp. SIO3B5]
MGFAHPGAEMLLLDDQKKEINQPNQVGEIYLRGANLFSGYWRNTKATNEALIPNPLNPLNGEKVFRTGDLAYKGSQGELYLKGRRDLQVKIRGNRVELEEIEQVLNNHEEVIQAIVVVFPHQKEPILTAYVVPRLFQSLPEQQILRKLCADVLPNYMIPTEIIYLESLPTNVNGQVDRQALKCWLNVN